MGEGIGGVGGVGVDAKGDFSTDVSNHLVITKLVMLVPSHTIKQSRDVLFYASAEMHVDYHARHIMKSSTSIVTVKKYITTAETNHRTPRATDTPVRSFVHLPFLPAPSEPGSSVPRASVVPGTCGLGRSTSTGTTIAPPLASS